MKKLNFTLISLCCMLGLLSCSKDLLEKFPLTEVSPQRFFKNEQDLILYTNSFYNYLNGTNVFTADNSSDNVEQNSVGKTMSGIWQVPETASEAGWTWTELREINYFLQQVDKADIEEKVKNNYIGLARFFRALFYFEKMKRFGDVPWYSTPLETNSPELYKGRDTRELITDSIIADLDFAVQYLNTTKNVSRVNKWTALALKSRVCLFEGTYRKYHTYLDLGSSSAALLTQAVTAADEIMKSGPYKLYSTNNPTVDYLTLFSADKAKDDEVILAEAYDTELKRFHAANNIFNVATTGGGVGLTKALMDSYLTITGKPFSSVSGYDTQMFSEETKDRDPRLSQTIRTPGYKRIGSATVLLPDFATAPTGYQNIKFVSGVDQDNYNTNANDIPLFRFAEVLLNFAEAKAELGSLSQAEVDRSINLIRKRAGIPNLVIGAIQTDPLMRTHNPGIVDDLLLEVRRERRVELAMEGFRYYDVMRWKLGKNFTNVFEGMYFPAKGEHDLDGDGKNDFAVVDALPNPKVPGIQYFVLGTRKLSEGTKGRILVSPNIQKKFDEPKNYLYPLPRTEMVLNPALKPQNTGWGE
ncbi:RagB/SusD family nutrient uptake outer membrane protein [Sphingobacterium faecale]|uniref:RagB/SusD family nutrient uptake outer membrane protein n=1 Tax=Sphingobacterium faecale TaxID=2803775 RepID=A0ABS1R9L3_9SPHI|nr:RagB/SusD family nutrient uptake outer membrane protein [Sphingobacterium faecale]MBL1410980.1 RagB/SusD family nutrient uptake outer membrane protein [Sphingobacterium faecale]